MHVVLRSARQRDVCFSANNRAGMPKLLEWHACNRGYRPHRSPVPQTYYQQSNISRMPLRTSCCYTSPHYHQPKCWTIFLKKAMPFFCICLYWVCFLSSPFTCKTKQRDTHINKLFHINMLETVAKANYRLLSQWQVGVDRKKGPGLHIVGSSCCQV